MNKLPDIKEQYHEDLHVNIEDTHILVRNGILFLRVIRDVFGVFDCKKIHVKKIEFFCHYYPC